MVPWNRRWTGNPPASISVTRNTPKKLRSRNSVRPSTPVQSPLPAAPCPDAQREPERVFSMGPEDVHDQARRQHHADDPERRIREAQRVRDEHRGKEKNGGRHDEINQPKGPRTVFGKHRQARTIARGYSAIRSK